MKKISRPKNTEVMKKVKHLLLLKQIKMLLGLVISISLLLVVRGGIVSALDNPVLSWGFNEGTGTTAYDSSTQSPLNNGTVSGASWRKEKCLEDKCLTFDGLNDYVYKTYDSDTELDPSTGNFSLSLWFLHTSALSSYPQYLVSRYSGAGYKIYIDTSGYMCFGIDDDSTWGPDDSACSSMSYADSKWHHLEGVKSGAAIYLYIDGVKIAEDASLSATGSLSGSSLTLYVGIDSDGISSAFFGILDEIRIYNTGSTASTVKTHYVGKKSNAGVAVEFSPDIGKRLEDGMLAYWKMDEGSWSGADTEVRDSSPNSFHGERAGDATTAAGKFGNAGSFDGTGDYVSFPNWAGTSQTSAVSIAGWINPSTVASEQTIMGKWDENANARSYRAFINSSGKLCGEISSDGQSGTVYKECSSTSLTASVYTHGIIAIGKSNAGTLDIKIYLNGVEDATTVTGTAISSIYGG